MSGTLDATRRTPGTSLAGCRATVMGLGLFGGGAAVARHLVRRGARVTVTDLRSAEELAPSLAALRELELQVVLGEHRREDFTRAELVVANPAVPRDAPLLREARARGVPITSEAALFLDACPARVAAVSGTQGKSSTCHFLAQLLQSAGRRTFLGGNIGHSLLDELDRMGPEDVAVVELSSYQLESLPDELGRPATSSAVELVALTNVLADHLERHGSLQAYGRAKLRLLELLRPGGTAIAARELLERCGPARPPAEVRWIEPQGPELALRDGRFELDGELLGRARDADRLPAFQRANLLVALGAARRLGAAPEELARALPALRGLPHRLEPLGPVAGHPVWDNGVSTTPDSTVAALEALAPGCALLCGGRPKRLAIDELAELAGARTRRVVLFGEVAGAWAERFRAAGAEVRCAPGVEQAVALAFELMEPGEPLLFSPAAASFDVWPNFRARAEAFRRALPGRAETPAGG